MLQCPRQFILIAGELEFSSNLVMSVAEELDSSVTRVRVEFESSYGCAREFESSLRDSLLRILDSNCRDTLRELSCNYLGTFMNSFRH
jgi:hypothetical protein